MPRYFKPWDEGLPTLRRALSALGDIKILLEGRRSSR